MTRLQPQKQDVETVECLGSAVEIDNETVNNALLETHAQKNMTIVQAARKYSKAIFFSALISLCIVMIGYDTALIGNFYGVSPLRGVIDRDDQWAWRIPYAIQWAWSPVITSGMLFAPESPAWLVGTDQVQRARCSLLKLSCGHVDVVEQTLALLVHTNAAEQSMETASRSVSYLDCFRGSDLRRTEATCGAWLV